MEVQVEDYPLGLISVAFHPTGPHDHTWMAFGDIYHTRFMGPVFKDGPALVDLAGLT